MDARPALLAIHQACVADVTYFLVLCIVVVHRVINFAGELQHCRLQRRIDILTCVMAPTPAISDPVSLQVPGVARTLLVVAVAAIG